MDSKKNTIILIVLFILIIAGAGFLYQNLSADYKMDSLAVEESANHSSENDGTQASPNSSSNEAANSEKESVIAPDFVVYDANQNQVHLSDFFGKPIVLNFWASWCGPCKMEMPDFHEAYKSYEDDITFLMVNMTDGSRETFDVASSFIADQGYTFPVYYDIDYSAATTYSVSSLPTTYFLNSKGELVAHAKGAIDGETLQKGIDMIMN